MDVASEGLDSDIAALSSADGANGCEEGAAELVNGVSAFEVQEEMVWL